MMDPRCTPDASRIADTPPEFLLAADMDGTLIPSVDDASRRADVVALVGALEKARSRLGLAYVTGRHLPHALEGVAAWALPVPDYLACEVGTSIFRRTRSGFEPDLEYADQMLAALGGTDADAIRAALRGVPGLSLQSPENQGRFKASFSFPWRRRTQVAAAVERRLHEQSLAGESVVSRSHASGEGLLDVLPRGGAKDRAVRHLASCLGLPLERVVFAGDSGNDTAALLCGARAVLVGNAPDEVREHVRAEARARGLENRLFTARAEATGGVMEGLRHFGVME